MASFRIFQDQENQGIEVKLGVKDMNQQQKRSVLGVLNKNTSRIQPLKTKDGKSCQEENICINQKVSAIQKTSFKIHEDKVENENLVQRNIKPVSEIVKPKEKGLPPSIAALHRVPFAEITDQFDNIYCDDDDDDDDDENDEENASPMSLDKSEMLDLEKSDKNKLALNLMLDVDEYKEEIYQYLRQREVRHRPKFGYMKKQPDITYSMRTILVDWLVEVAEEYKLQTETLYLAVSYIDRFLSFMSVVRAKLQLVGTAAMFVAAKYEEIYPPDVGEFVYITDDTYTKKQVLRMEHLLLKVLAFDLSVPTPLSFITSFRVVTNLPETTMFLAMYLCELSLLEADPFLQYLPSELAASAIALARYTLEQEAWPEEYEEAIGYTLVDLKPCISDMNTIYATISTRTQQAIREKYKSDRWHNVSHLVPRDPAL